MCEALCSVDVPSNVASQEPDGEGISMLPIFIDVETGSETFSNLPRVNSIHPSLLLKTSLCCMRVILFYAMQPGFESGLCSF